MLKYKLLDFEIFIDNRGSLVSVETGKNISFDIKRVYYIFNLKNEFERGFHAHLNSKQAVIPLKGSCNFILDDGIKRISLKLDKPNKALFIEGGIWREMKNFSSDCILLVLSNMLYDPNDYIRDYKEFLRLIKQ